MQLQQPGIERGPKFNAQAASVLLTIRATQAHGNEISRFTVDRPTLRRDVIGRIRQLRETKRCTDFTASACFGQAAQGLREEQDSHFDYASQ